MEKATMTAELLLERVDIEKYEQLANNPEENKLYFELQKQLTELLEYNPITYMYVVVPPAEGEEAMTLVDAGDLQSGDVYALGDTMDGVYYKEVMASIEEIGSYSEFESTEEFGDLISSYVPLKNAEGEIFAVLGVDDNFVLLNTIQQKAVKDIFPLFMTVIVLSSGLIVLGIGAYLYRLLNPLEGMREATFKLDEGDLTQAQIKIDQVNLKRNTSITAFGKSFRSALGSLIDSIRNIRKVSNDVSETTCSIQGVTTTIDGSTNALLSSIQEISGSVQEQEAITTQTLYAMSQMSDDVQQITQQVRTAVAHLNDTSALIHRSSANANDASQQVQGMTKTVQQTASDVQELTEKYSSIESMVEVIQNIADQTNLLALNASIESARAGEYGKGFAVVAEEVRKLAELTKDSAGEIRQQIGEFKGVTELVLTNMLNSKNEVQLGAERVHSISSDLTEVQLSADKVRDEVQAVELITTKIEARAQDVSTAISQSNEASQHVVHGTNIVQSAATAQEEMLVTLKVAIDDLMSNVGSLESVLGKYKI